MSPSFKKTLGDPKTKRTFTLMMAAAAIIQDKNPKRAFALYVQAKPLLPKNEAGEIDARIAERFFDAWLALLLREKKMPQAEEMLKSRITFLGSGYAALLKLQLDQKEDAHVAATLQLLALPSAPECEILAAASLLNNRWEKNRDQTQIADQSVALLNAYLSASRPRSVPAELQARFRLGWVLFGQKKTAEAKIAIAIDHLKFDETQLDSDTASTLKNIRALQLRLDATPE